MTGIESHQVGGVLQDWLNTLDLQSVDVVRARLALLVAAELDAPDTPRHAIPRLSSQLRGVISEIGATKAKNGVTKADVRKLLEVVR